MKKEEIVVGGVYSNDRNVGVRVTRITAPNANQRSGVVYWVYAFWDRVEPVPEIVYEDTMLRFAHWARERVDEPVENGEVPFS